jgi:DNA-binding transcriptional regulator YiaG
VSTKRVFEPEWLFADRLRKVRVDCTSLTREEFAAALGFGRSRYGAWEDGRNVPRDAVMWEIAVKLQELYGVSTRWTMRTAGE